MDEYTTTLDQWSSLYPLNDLDGGHWDGMSIASPEDLVRVAQVRSMAAARRDLGETCEIDVFLFGLGEPGRRDVTKVGGLPYRLAGLPWPRSSSGAPMTFLAQFRFAESKDLVGELPGDVLLVFAVNDELGWPDNDDDQLCFEWYASGATEGLVCAEELPSPAWRFVKCYGVRCRTEDYIADDAAQGLGESLGYREGGDEWYSLGSIARLAGMKIGGAPLCIDADHNEAMLPGKFLCSLATIVPRPESPYPWVNHPSPIGFSEFYRDENKLDFRDGFLLNLWLDQRMSIAWSLQFW